MGLFQSRRSLRAWKVDDYTAKCKSDSWKARDTQTDVIHTLRAEQARHDRVIHKALGRPNSIYDIYVCGTGLVRTFFGTSDIKENNLIRSI